MDLLSAQGFVTSRSSVKGSAAELTGNRRPDIVVLDLQSDEAGSDLPAFLALAKTLKKSPLACKRRSLARN